MTLYNELLIKYYDNFKVYTNNPNLENNYLKSLMEFFLEEYTLIFSKQLISNSECYIIYDPKAKTPIFYPRTNPSSIFLNHAGDGYWAQIIYQLSHELCHYTLAQKSYDKDPLKWFEESLCEAMSLYILKFCSDKWSDCKLSKHNYDFKFSLAKYLKDLVEYENITYGLKECTSLSDLIKINSTSESIRSDRMEERNYVYKLFKQYRDDIHLITDYRKYIIADILIDFEKWIEDTNNNEFITKLSQIQPNIKY